MNPNVTSRSALLIGITEYRHEGVRQIPVVSTDVGLMRQALEESSYNTTVLTGQGGTPEPTRGQIRQSVRDLLSAAGEGSTVLIYFSGHGVRVAGADYLCPSDMPGSQYQGSEDDLLSADLGALAKGALDSCKAKTIVFIIDACRDVVGAKATTLEVASSTDETKQRVATLYSCTRGDSSYFDEERIGGSIFTVAVAEALKPDTEPRTIEQVVAYIRDRMEVLRREAALPAQTAEFRPEYASDDWAERVICAGTNDDELWRKAQLASLQLLDDADPQIRERFETFLRTCHGFMTRPGSATGASLWLDNRQVDRYVRRVGDLIEAGFVRGNTVQMRITSLGLLVVIEASLRVRYAEALDVALENQGSSVQQPEPGTLLRRAEHLDRLGKPDLAETLRTWLIQRSVYEDADVWKSPVAVQLLDKLLDCLEDRATHRLQLRQHLSDAAWTIVSDRPRFDEVANLTVYTDITDKPSSLPLAECIILARTAYAMSADFRQTAGPLVNELGLRSGLDIILAKQEMADIAWRFSNSNERLIHVDAICSHPATELALRASIATVRQTQIDESAIINNHLVLDESGIRASSRGQTTSYTRPISKVTLDPDAVRTLLMGKDLYGTPKVVVRELYQNALDACRYRSTRERYLATTHAERVNAWKPKISFRLHRIEDGTLVLDCLDTGVGMGSTEVDEAFTRAGRRFTDLAMFKKEKEQWANVDEALILHPNSRFGIGVFSYFLLAEEVEVFTVRQQSDGSFQEGLQLHLSSVSGLTTKRALSADMRAPISDGGTLVRLFLNEREWAELDTSLVDLLEELLGYAEIDLSASDEGVDRLWPAGSFIGFNSNPHHATTKEHVTIWWTDGSAPLMADGVRLEQRTVGYVANLGGAHRPILDVSRNKTTSWDVEWVEGQLAQSTKSLESWDKLSLPWLWVLSAQSRNLADAVFQRLISEDVELLVSPNGSDKKALKEVGVQPIDASLLRFSILRDEGELTAEIEEVLTQQSPEVQARFGDWRSSLWANHVRLDRGVSVRVTTNAPGATLRHTRYMLSRQPVPSPTDSALLNWMVRRNQVNFEAPVVVFPANLIRAAATFSLPIDEVARRLARFAPGLIDLGESMDWLAGADVARQPTMEESVIAEFADSERIPYAAPFYHPDDSVGFYLSLLQVLSRSSLEPGDVADMLESMGGDSATVARLRSCNTPPQYLVDAVPKGPARRAGRRLRVQGRFGYVRVNGVERGLQDQLVDWLVETGVIEASGEWRTLPLDDLSDDECRIMSQDNDGQIPWLTGEYTSKLVLQKSVNFGVSPSTICELFDRAGLTRSTSFDLGSVDASSVPTDQLRRLLRLSDWEPGREGSTDPEDEDFVRDPSSFTLAEIFGGIAALMLETMVSASECVAALRGFGFDVPEEWGERITRPETQADLLLIRAFLGRVRQNNSWPFRHDLIDTVTACYDISSDLRSNLAAMTKLGHLGLHCAQVDLTVVPLPVIDSNHGRVLSRLISLGWDTRLALALCLEAVENPESEWLAADWWWLRTMLDEPDRILQLLQEGGVYGFAALPAVVPAAGSALFEGRPVTGGDVLLAAVACNIEVSAVSAICEEWGIDTSIITFTQDRADWVDAALILTDPEKQLAASWLSLEPGELETRVGELPV